MIMKIDLNNNLVLSCICGLIASIVTYINEEPKTEMKKKLSKMFYNFITTALLVYGALYMKKTVPQKGGGEQIPSTFSNNVQINDPHF